MFDRLVLIEAYDRVPVEGGPNDRISADGITEVVPDFLLAAARIIRVFPQDEIEKGNGVVRVEYDSAGHYAVAFVHRDELEGIAVMAQDA